MLKSLTKISLISKNCVNLAYFSSDLKYHPLKRLDFSKSDYQCIYRNDNNEKYVKLMGKSIMLAHCPSFLVLGYYLAFLDLYSLYNIFLVGASFFMSFRFAKFRLSPRRIFVKELYISKNGKSFKCFYTRDARKVQEKHLTLIKFDYDQIVEKKIVKFNIFDDEKKVEKEDLCLLKIEGNEDDEIDIKLFFQENSLTDCNEYIIALGQGKQIVMK